MISLRYTSAMERKDPFVEDNAYHLYNRGVEKRSIFTSVGDYRRFMMLLYLANSNQEAHISNVLKTQTYDEVFTRDRGEPLVAIGSFCLMPNHFHILVTPKVEGGISQFMLKLQTGYSMFFNKKNERKGSLFEGPFKSTLADDDRYLQYLFAYIHLNPAKLKDPKWKERIKRNPALLRFVESYSYSSYGAYLTGVHTITNPEAFPEYFSSKKEVRQHITDWLEPPEDE